jgi:hypothetical protein
MHLSHTAPLARQGEPDWYMSMWRVLNKLSSTAVIFGDTKFQKGALPVVVAGDIFDRWNAPAELINFACEHMPVIYAVPGQHDLPNHNYADIKRSAYWTLVEAGKIVHLEYGQPRQHFNGRLLISGFAWGQEIKPYKREATRFPQISLAVCHRYIHNGIGTNYMGASGDYRVSKLARKLNGYDAAVFGDNHIGFQFGVGDCNVLNGGTLMRRSSADIDYEPHVGILYDNGYIAPVSMRIDGEIIERVEEPEDLPASTVALDGLINELRSGASSADFIETVWNWLDGAPVGKQVKAIVREFVNHERKKNTSATPSYR